MRGTTLILVLALVGVMFSGCMFLEQAAKAGASGALEVLNAQIPVLSKTLKEEIKGQIHTGIEKIGLAAAEKAHATGMKFVHFAIRKAGKDPMAYDFDGSGGLSDMEAGIGMNEAAESGEWPWYLKVLAGLGILGGTGGAAGGSFSILKTLSRYIDARSEKKTKAIVANGGGAPLVPGFAEIKPVAADPDKV